MASSNDFLDFILDQLSNWKIIHPKKMFGVIGLYVDGYMFGIVAKEVVFFKVDDSNIVNYRAAESQALKLFKNNSIVASFYEVPVYILEDASNFVLWAEESLNIQKKITNKK